MVLVRGALGEQLRRHRLAQQRTLRDVSGRAQVSLGYLSEVERGQKEASSELLAAICTALEVPLSAVLRDVSDDLALQELVSAQPGRGQLVAAPGSGHSAQVPREQRVHPVDIPAGVPVDFAA